MKKISILGVTGSIGTQAIEVILQHDQFELVGISAGNNISLLEEIMAKVDVDHISVIKETDCKLLQTKYPEKSFYFGEAGLIKIATLSNVDLVLNAIVGFAGLVPTIEAIKCKKNIALANKETLVVAGHIIMPLAKEYNVKILPVDSEHSAIFQSLQGSKQSEVSKIILTCSGGSFFNKTKNDLKDVTVKEALNHPNWSMGAKITIDSATLFNKGLEVIEAKWLFDIEYKDIEVVVHPQSVIHSLVEYIDTSVIAQLGTPDMKLPIQYAFSYPNRINLPNSKRLNLIELSKMTFMEPDHSTFKGLKLAYKAGEIGGSMPCVLNAANEVANAMFLNGTIRFLDISDIVEETMELHNVIQNPDLKTLIKIDEDIRKIVTNNILNKS